VSDALALPLTGEQQRQLAKLYTQNGLAYQLYLQGRYFWNKRTVEGLEKGIEYFQQAVDQDPRYALAYTGLADCYTLLGFYGAEARGVMPRAKAAAARALELDDSLAEAHTSLGGVAAVYDWDWARAEREFGRALELNPNYTPAHHWYAILVLAAQGRRGESIAEMRRAVDLDPVSPLLRTDLGWAYFLAGQDGPALEQYRKALDLDPSFLEAHDRFWRYYQYRSMSDEAIAEWEKAERIAGRGSTGTVESAFHLGGYKKALREIVVYEQKEREDSYDMAVFYALAGEEHQAMGALQKSFQNREPGIIYLKVDPLLNSLQSDPRYQDLLRRMGLS
jgi:tetratricopeptide (TPR) repeat protein